MGLEERRKIKELQDTTFPERTQELKEITGADIAYDIDWDRYDDGYAYDDSYGYGPGPNFGAPAPAFGADYAAPGYGGKGSYYEERTDYRAVPPPVPAPTIAYRGGYAGTYFTPPGTTTTIVIPGATTTTTTTEYITETYRPVARKVYRAPVKKKWRPRARCTCTCTYICR